MIEYDPGGPESHGFRVGDVTSDELGNLFVAGLDSAANITWIDLTNCNQFLQSVFVSILRTCRVLSEAETPAMRCPNVETQRKLRKPSIYNSHISAVLRKLAEIAPDMSRTERMQIAVKTWKELQKTAVSDSQKRDASADVVAILEQRLRSP